MNTKLILAFLLGLLSGGGGVGFFLKKRFDKELDDIYTSVEMIQNQLGFSDEDMTEIKKPVDFLRKMKIDPPPEEEYEDDVDDYEDEESDADDSDFDVDDPEVLFPDPEIDLNTVDKEKTVVTEDREWSVKVKPTKPKPIHNISDKDYFEGEPDYAKTGIKYYPKVNVFVDLNDEVLDNAEKVIGKGLLFFGLNSRDKDVVYIRNVKMKTDIEVVRMEE